SAMGRPSLEKEALAAAERVRAGEALAQAVSAIPYVGPELARWAAVGEAGGCLPKMLGAAAARLKARWERVLAMRLAMLEPVLLAAIGAFVFALALALLLPVLDMAKAASL
ncbi:MAG: type II secretion system F family protein, partial [Kiritimatiellae bacterium]|nr:type II secretion system F family protein [Kiritimatiellia bacterium]